MHRDITRQFSDIAVDKINYFRQNPLGFFISTMMAGAYVGIGLILIMTLGNEAEIASRKLIMGCFFGITLTLIIFAGAELFSGHTMYMTFGFFYKKSWCFYRNQGLDNLLVRQSVRGHDAVHSVCGRGRRRLA